MSHSKTDAKNPNKDDQSKPEAIPVINNGFNVLSKCHSYFFFQAEDGIRDVERSRGLGDVYKRQD